MSLVNDKSVSCDYGLIILREYNGSEPVFIDAFSRGVRRSYVECCSMINRVPEIEVADPMEVFILPGIASYTAVRVHVCCRLGTYNESGSAFHWD